MRLVVSLLAVLPLVAVQAQQPTTITLACSGTSKLMVASSDTMPDPITNVGMIVNFGARLVSFEGYKIPISQSDSTTVTFHGQQVLTYAGRKLQPITVDGSIDRVTGAASVMFMHDQIGNNSTWDLMCRPAARMF